MDGSSSPILHPVTRIIHPKSHIRQFHPDQGPPQPEQSSPGRNSRRLHPREATGMAMAMAMGAMSTLSLRHPTQCLTRLRSSVTDPSSHLICLFSVTIMKRQRDSPPIIEVDDDGEDEFEPLFNYSKSVVPVPTFLSDDSDEEDVVIASAPKRRPEITPAKEPSTQTPQKAPAKKVVLDDDDDDDDDSWLMSSSPKLPKMPQPAFSTGNHALQQLREKRRELMTLQQLASPGAIRNIEELARIQAQQRPEAEPPKVVKSHVEPPKSEDGASEEKEKILIKVQDKSGNSQSIRIYATDKFEKLFALYAKMVKASLPNLSFRFDGDQLGPNSTPKEHDMEDEDIIEVYDKSASS